MKGPLHQSSPTLPQGLTFHRYVPAFAIVHCFPSSAPDSSFSGNKALSNSNRSHYFFQGRRIHRNYGNSEKQTKDTARFILLWFKTNKFDQSENKNVNNTFFRQGNYWFFLICTNGKWVLKLSKTATVICSVLRGSESLRNEQGIGHSSWRPGTLP